MAAPRADRRPATMVAVPDREWFRQLVAIPPGPCGLLVPGGPLLKVLALWDVVAVVHLVLTYRTYRTTDPTKLQALASSHRRGLADRLLFAFNTVVIASAVAVAVAVASTFLVPAS